MQPNGKEELTTIIRRTAAFGKMVCLMQPLDNNDNTGEKNEVASLIGNFNPAWDAEGGTDKAFFQAVNIAGMILENKFERYRGNERAATASSRRSENTL